MDEMTKLWLPHLGKAGGTYWPGAKWFPKCTTGKNALPGEYDIPWNQNPTPSKQEIAHKGHRIAKLEQLTHRMRYLYYLRDTRRMDNVDLFNEMVKHSAKVGFHGTLFSTLVWPKGWNEKLIACIRKGMTLTGSIKLLKLHKPTVLKFYRNMPGFKMDIDEAVADRQQDLIDNMTDIAMNGDMENNKLKATMFLLERRYPEDYGAHQTLEITKPTAPMDRLMAMANGQDGDKE